MHMDLAKTRFGWKLIDTEEFPKATAITWFRLILPQINRKDSGSHKTWTSLVQPSGVIAKGRTRGSLSNFRILTLQGAEHRFTRGWG